MAGAIGQRLQVQNQRIGRVDHAGWRLAGQAPQFVGHDGGVEMPLLARQSAGQIQRLHSSFAGNHQHFGKSAIPLGLFERVRPHGLNRRRQLPAGERQAMAQGAGFGFEHGEIMPRLADQLVAGKTALVARDKLSAGHNGDAGGADARRHHSANPLRGNGIAVAVDIGQAGAGNPQGLLDSAIESHADRRKRRLLRRKDSRDRGWLRWMVARPQFPASLGQPFIQPGKS